MTLLSVNLNKVALLRNSRGNDYPNVLAMAKRAVLAGAQGITLHPRPDARHATYDDVREIAAWAKTQNHIEFNVEGYPSDDFMALVLETQPDQCTLVPDLPGQLTSDHGWNVKEHESLLTRVLDQLQTAGVRSSLFMDPDALQIAHLESLNVDRIELYTESFARAHESGRASDVLDQYAQTAKAAKALGLGINAGHDLNLNNLKDLLLACQALDASVQEVSIGHAIMVESFHYGFENTIERYVNIIESIK